MAFDSVPWFIGGQAEHSAESARNLAWNATQGRTGIARPSDLSVRAQSTPAASVRVNVGGGAIESTYAGAGQQSYMVRSPSVTDVAVPANTSGSTVTRYIVVEIGDPQYKGAYPSDKVNGPYVFPKCVNSLNTGHPVLPLARIVMPPNTAAVTGSMIRDIREMLSPRREEVVFARPRILADNVNRQQYLTDKTVGGEYFPGGGSSPNGFDYDIPSWATMMIVEADWMSLRYEGGKSSWGAFWMEYGNEFKADGWPRQHDWEFATQEFAWDADEKSATYRNNWRLMDAVPVPTKLRGKNAQFVFKARIDASASALRNVIQADAGSGLGCRLTFIEKPEDADMG